MVRRYGHFDESEDAVQEALLTAATRWPADGVPDNPRAWLITIASRRLTDQLRSDQARKRREDTVAARQLPEDAVSPPADVTVNEADDTLTLLFMCCHPSLTETSQIALTLRAVGGLTTQEIARAFLVPEPTMGQRISRAKQRVNDSSLPFRLPPVVERSEKLGAVLHVLYLIFNEGYTATAGPNLHRADLSNEAIRLTRGVHRLLPDDGEVAGLLALMLLTDARRTARIGPTGELIPLAEQDRERWDHRSIATGVELVSRSLATAVPGPYQIQAAIAAVHSEATGTETTDWPQIVELYRILEQMSPGPVVTLNRAVAVAMVDGPKAGLDLLSLLDNDPHMKRNHRLEAVRAHLYEMAGATEAARAAYLKAAKLTTSQPEQDYLRTRAAKYPAP